MKMLKRLKDTYLLKRRIEELEASLQSKEELIQTDNRIDKAVHTRLFLSYMLEGNKVGC